VKVLHLFSDWKWTGPAEPTVSLCEALSKAGVDVTLAYRKTPIDFPERTVEKAVKGRGLKAYDGFTLNRYFSTKDWVSDVMAIRRYVTSHDIDILHTNLSHDHFLALMSYGLSGRKPILVRTDHKRDGLPRDPFMRWAIGRTDGLVTYSERIMRADRKNFRLPSEKTCIIPPAIKLFTGTTTDVRPSLNLSPGDRVIGIIGRLKPDRGYDIVLKAFRLLKDDTTNVKLVIMGRSSQIEQSIRRPLVELGLQSDVILAGYRIEDYFSVIATFDMFVMMRAGSDGTARALREVMSMGVPAIVSDRGMLPDLVDTNITGFVVPWDPYELAQRFRILLDNKDLRLSMGEMARKTAREKWTFEKQAFALKAFYERLIAKRTGR